MTGFLLLIMLIVGVILGWLFNNWYQSITEWF